jgi:hypothetical protein
VRIRWKQRPSRLRAAPAHHHTASRALMAIRLQNTTCRAETGRRRMSARLFGKPCDDKKAKSTIGNKFLKRKFCSIEVPRRDRGDCVPGRISRHLIPQHLRHCTLFGTLPAKRVQRVRNLGSKRGVCFLF